MQVCIYRCSTCAVVHTGTQVYLLLHFSSTYGSVLVLDGNMKNRRDVCSAKDARFIQFALVRSRPDVEVLLHSKFGTALNTDPRHVIYRAVRRLMMNWVY